MGNEVLWVEFQFSQSHRLLFRIESEDEGLEGI